MLYLLMRLPGAAAHALEQHWAGTHSFPFYREGLSLPKSKANECAQDAAMDSQHDKTA